MLCAEVRRVQLDDLIIDFLVGLCGNQPAMQLSRQVFIGEDLMTVGQSLVEAPIEGLSPLEDAH